MVYFKEGIRSESPRKINNISHACKFLKTWNPYRQHAILWRTEWDTTYYYPAFKSCQNRHLLSYNITDEMYWKLAVWYPYKVREACSKVTHPRSFTPSPHFSEKTSKPLIKSVLITAKPYLTRLVTLGIKYFFTKPKTGFLPELLQVGSHHLWNTTQAQNNIKWNWIYHGNIRHQCLQQKLWVFTPFSLLAGWVGSFNVQPHLGFLYLILYNVNITLI